MSDQRWNEFAGDEFVRRTRRTLVHSALTRALRAERDRTPGTRSIMVLLAQFWNDQADDEVHAMTVSSRRDVPEWPHDCRFDEVYRPLPGLDDCDFCGGAELDGWGYGDMIPAFEPFCHERGNQNHEPVQNYRPFALARVLPSGDVEARTCGHLVRPWSDLPREPAPELPLEDTARALVCALRDDPAARLALMDAMLERGDPRAELLSLAGMAPPARTPEQAARLVTLEDAYLRTFLGPLDAYAPRAAVRSVGGVPSAIGVYVRPADAEAFAAIEPRAFGAIDRLRFLPGSARPVSPGLARMRALGPLDDAALDALPARLDVEVLEVEPAGHAALARALSRPSRCRPSACCASWAATRRLRCSPRSRRGSARCRGSSASSSRARRRPRRSSSSPTTSRRPAGRRPRCPSWCASSTRTPGARRAGARRSAADGCA